MKVITRLFFLDEEDEKFFGEGPYRLLKQVEETGSLHSAASVLGMAYSKATKLLKNAEKSLGFPLTVRRIGGKSGGGSVLTEEAKDFLRRYEAYRNDCMIYNEKMFEKYFGDTEKIEGKYEGKPEGKLGCIIMASGLGKRFGGDKLTVELFEKPMIQYVVEATEGLFAYRVVVTRNEKVKSWCEQRNLPVVFHNLPDRNDTVRLGLEELEKNFQGELTGCMFCPADMPFMNRKSLQNMISKVENKTDGILRMRYQKVNGSPVLFGKDYFDDLKKLPKGKGGSEVIKEHKDKLIFVEAKSEYEIWDVDTTEDFEKVKNKMLELKKI